MKDLTSRQQMVLDVIRLSINERGYPPTLREIGLKLGIRSTNGVNDHLTCLERKGYLQRQDMKSRALRLTELGGGSQCNGQEACNCARSQALRLRVVELEERLVFIRSALEANDPHESRSFIDLAMASTAAELKREAGRTDVPRPLAGTMATTLDSIRRAR